MNRTRFSPSTIVLAWAIALLAAPAAFAQAAVTSRPASASTGELQSLVNATVTQFRIAYRHDEAERSLHREQLAAAVNAWREAPRSDANNQRLAQWLREAIRNSMPGSREPLPAVPEFDRASIVRRPKLPPTTRQKPVMPTQASHGGDSASAPADESAPTTTSVPTTGSPPAGDVDSSQRDLDFWSQHPSAGELPDDLTSGDPFRDDP